MSKMYSITLAICGCGCPYHTLIDYGMADSYYVCDLTNKEVEVWKYESGFPDFCPLEDTDDGESC